MAASGTAGRKKDAETECAVDACTKLDSKGLLRTDTSISAALAEERRKRMRELFGDQDEHSDDDDFFDRAGSGTGARPMRRCRRITTAETRVRCATRRVGCRLQSAAGKRRSRRKRPTSSKSPRSSR